MQAQFGALLAIAVEHQHLLAQRLLPFRAAELGIKLRRRRRGYQRVGGRGALAGAGGGESDGGRLRWGILRRTFGHIVLRRGRGLRNRRRQILPAKGIRARLRFRRRLAFRQVRDMLSRRVADAERGFIAAGRSLLSLR